MRLKLFVVLLFALALALVVLSAMAASDVESPIEEEVAAFVAVDGCPAYAAADGVRACVPGEGGVPEPVMLCFEGDRAWPGDEYNYLGKKNTDQATPIFASDSANDYEGWSLLWRTCAGPLHQWIMA